MSYHIISYNTTSRRIISYHITRCQRIQTRGASTMSAFWVRLIAAMAAGNEAGSLNGNMFVFVSIAIFDQACGASSKLLIPEVKAHKGPPHPLGAHSQR